MAYPSSRGSMVKKLQKKGIAKLDGIKIEKLGKQELVTLFNKVGR